MTLRFVALCGGVGGARFLAGLKHLIARERLDAEVTAIVNTGDDLWLHGLKICPDLDTVMYTLGEGIDPERGWGRRDETWSVKEELAQYGAEAPWFGLGDRDIATHLMRTQMLDAGYSLSAVTEALCQRWQPGVRLLPMSDDRVETHIAIADAEEPSGRRVIHFQEYWVRMRAQVPAEAVIAVGVDKAAPGPGVLEAIGSADVIFLPPSNPVVSLGTILGVGGQGIGSIREAIRQAPGRVVGLSPIVGNTHVLGMAEQMLNAIGVEVSAAGVGIHYGARTAAGVLDGWLIADRDAEQTDRVIQAGVACAARPLMMTSPDASADMARAALDLVAPDLLSR